MTGWEQRGGGGPKAHPDARRANGCLFDGALLSGWGPLPPPGHSPGQPEPGCEAKPVQHHLTGIFFQPGQGQEGSRPVEVIGSFWNGDSFPTAQQHPTPLRRADQAG